MVFPSRELARGAIAKRDTAGGVPLGLTARILGSLPAALCAPFFFCSASAWDPARSAGDMPSSDNIFRLLTFMDETPPYVLPSLCDVERTQLELRNHFTSKGAAGFITSTTHFQEPSGCFFQIATPLLSSVTDLPSGPFKDIRSVPVE